MPLVLKDRVQETTTTTGTGTVTLAGAVVGFQSFSVIGDGNTTYYTITSPTDFEVGIGTFTAAGTLLSRDTILESSNSGNAVDFAAGIKTVFVTYPAERAVDTVIIQTLTNKTIDITTNTLTGVQPTLVSGTSIKTVNSTSLLGSGDVAVGDVTLAGTQTLTNKTIDITTNTLTGVQPTLVSGTSIKTVNNTSVLGSGNISIAGGAEDFVLQFNGFDAAPTMGVSGFGII